MAKEDKNFKNNINTCRKRLSVDIGEALKQIDKDIKEIEDMKDKEGKAFRLAIARLLPKLSEHRVRLLNLKNHTAMIRALIDSGVSGSITTEEDTTEEEQPEENP